MLDFSLYFLVLIIIWNSFIAGIQFFIIASGKQLLPNFGIVLPFFRIIVALCYGGLVNQYVQARVKYCSLAFGVVVLHSIKTFYIYWIFVFALFTRPRPFSREEKNIWIIFIIDIFLMVATFGIIFKRRYAKQSNSEDNV